MSDSGQGWRLKDGGEHFAAGDRFQRALRVLQGESFRLFAWICLHAERPRGKLAFRASELARQLGVSSRSIQRHLRAIEQAGVCELVPASNRHRDSVVIVCPDFWPYGPPQPLPPYEAAVRAAYETSPCVAGRFSPADERLARQWRREGVPLEDVLRAILLLSVRKTDTLLDSRARAHLGRAAESDPVRSLAYFARGLRDPDLAALTGGYREYLQLHLSRSEAWLSLPPGELARRLFPRLCNERSGS